MDMDLGDENLRLLEGPYYLTDDSDERIPAARQTGRVSASSSSNLSKVRPVVCVPTPLARGKPDLSSVMFAGEELRRALTAATCSMLVDTTYPGTSEAMLMPLLEAGALEVGRDLVPRFVREPTDCGRIVGSR